MEDGRELKAWDAIARYMQSFEDIDGDGIANVPEYYAVTHNRKVVDDSTNIIDLVKNPNRFSVMIVLICLLFLVIIILIVVLIRKLVRKALESILPYLKSKKEKYVILSQKWGGIKSDIIL